MSRGVDTTPTTSEKSKDCPPLWTRPIRKEVVGRARLAERARLANGMHPRCEGVTFINEPWHTRGNEHPRALTERAAENVNVESRFLLEEVISDSTRGRRLKQSWRVETEPFSRREAFNGGGSRSTQSRPGHCPGTISVPRCRFHLSPKDWATRPSHSRNTGPRSARFPTRSRA